MKLMKKVFIYKNVITFDGDELLPKNFQINVTTNKQSALLSIFFIFYFSYFIKAKNWVRLKFNFKMKIQLKKENQKAKEKLPSTRPRVTLAFAFKQPTVKALTQCI